MEDIVPYAALGALLLITTIVVMVAAICIWEDLGLGRFIHRHAREFRMHSRHSRIWAVTIVLVFGIVFGTSLAESLLVPPKPAAPIVAEREKTVYDALHACVDKGGSTRDSQLCTQIVDLVRQQGVEARIAKLEAK